MKKLKYCKIMLLLPLLVWGSFLSFYLFSDYTIEETSVESLYGLAISQHGLSKALNIFTRDFPEFVAEEEQIKSKELTELVNKISKIYSPSKWNDIHPTRPLQEGKNIERFFIFRDSIKIYFVFTSKFRFFTPEELFLPGAIHDENFVRFIKDIKKL